MRASGRRTWLRRVVALALLAGLVVAGWLLFLRGEGDGDEADSRPAGVSRQAEEVVRGLDAAQQAEQVLLLGFEGTDATARGVRELRRKQLGGVLVGSENGADPDLLAALRRAGRSGGRIPPLIVAAHEGGIYRAFEDLPPEDRAIDIGDRGSVERAAAWAEETAQALSERGFNLNLFPVADVATLDSPVGGRAFSDDSGLAAELTAATIRACAEARLACAPLHFPGLGAASQDTAEGPASVSLDRATLSSRDLAPFRAAIAEKAPALVLSLALYSAYDPVTPGALVPEIATELLRERLRFRGLAITDDLGSGAARATHAVPRAAVAALRAGADLLQIASPSDARGVTGAIRAAVESGELSTKRLADAAARVLELKREVGLIGNLR